MLYGAGSRHAEAVALDVGDYDPESGALTIRRGKGHKGRVTYATYGAREALAAWLTVRSTQPGPLFVAVDQAEVAPVRWTGPSCRLKVGSESPASPVLAHGMPNLAQARVETVPAPEALPAPLVVAGSAASRLAEGTVLAGCGAMGMFGVQTWRRFAACSRGCAEPCMHEWHPGMQYGPFATCEEALSVASGLIRGGVHQHHDAEASVILQGSAVIAVVSTRRN